MDEASPFYPPRARWYAVFFALGQKIRRRLALDRLRMPRRTEAAQLLLGFLVPGLAVFLRGPRLWGQVALSASTSLGLIYLMWLGYPAANLAFGLLISLHVTGFVYACQPVRTEQSFRSRLLLTLVVLIAMVSLLYLPARTLVQRHLLMPLQAPGGIVVVSRFFPAQAIHPGQWLAYELAENSAGNAHREGAVWFHGGTALGPVLAVAGDHVTFSATGYFINGNFHPSPPHMPVSGEWVVPEKHWFIWPNLAISGHGNVSDDTLSRMLLQLADVAPSQYLGQPFRHWFWRRQIVP